MTVDPTIPERWWMPDGVANGSVKVSWDNASEACRVADSHLVSITSSDENLKFKEFLEGRISEVVASVWIGANDKEREVRPVDLEIYRDIGAF